MKLREGNMISSVQNVNSFLIDNAAEIGDAVNDGTKKAVLESLTELSDQVAMQDSHIRAAAGSLNRQRVSRTQLVRDHMAPIARIAILRLPEVPELVKLTLPRKRSTLQQLAGQADGMADAAARYADVFITNGRKPDFVAQLKASAADMRSAHTERALSRRKVKQATTDLGEKLSRSRKVVAMIDSVLQSALAEKPGLLAAWNMTKRVQITRGSSKTAATPETPAVPAAPVKDVVG